MIGIGILTAVVVLVIIGSIAKLRVPFKGPRGWTWVQRMR